MPNAFTIPKVSVVAEALKKDARKARTTPKTPNPISLAGSSKHLPPKMMEKK